MEGLNQNLKVTVAEIFIQTNKMCNIHHPCVIYYMFLKYIGLDIIFISDLWLEP